MTIRIARYVKGAVAASMLLIVAREANASDIAAFAGHPSYWGNFLCFQDNGTGGVIQTGSEGNQTQSTSITNPDCSVGPYGWELELLTTGKGNYSPSLYVDNAGFSGSITCGAFSASPDGTTFVSTGLQAPPAFTGWSWLSPGTVKLKDDWTLSVACNMEGGTEIGTIKW